MFSIPETCVVFIFPSQYFCVTKNEPNLNTKMLPFQLTGSKLGLGFSCEMPEVEDENSG